MTVLLVALGGAVGSLIRMVLARLNADVPWGTLTANLVGSLLLGLLVGADLGDGSPVPPLTTVLGAGVLGGLTTFSTLMVEVAGATRTGRPAPVSRERMGYLLVSVAAGLALGALGLVLGRQVLGG